jgi:hypothetical protein
MGRQKVDLQWSKMIAVQNCTLVVNYAGSRFLVLPTHVFEEAILQTSKIHNLFI